MASIIDLKSVSADDLRAEILARAQKLAGGTDAVARGAGAASPMAEVGTDQLVTALAAKEKVIYGVDDRKDFHEFPNDDVKRFAASVAALFSSSDITSNGDKTSTLKTETLAVAQGVCPLETFSSQPVGAFCTGFLVAPDVIATAGHCVNAGNVTTVRFVFGFRMENATTAVVRINDADIYSGAALLGRVEQSAGPDWALVRMDRPAKDRPVLAIRKTGQIAAGAAVSVMGHPSGLPVKYAAGSVVRDNSPAAFFVANLDTYGGNSGSPVFDDNFVVEGILVRGETDYVSTGTCFVSKVCPSTGCRGEDCTRITEINAVLIA